MEIISLLIRFIITFVSAMLFGFERQRSHKPIGFGTFVFVGVGSCGLAMAAVSINKENPLPLLSGIVTGIGFLGAGALIKTNDKIFGVTTAASIWAFAIFGILIGVGEYLAGMMIYLFMWFVVIIDRYLENKGIGSYQRKLVIKTNRMVPDKDIRNLLLIHLKRFKIVSVDIDKSNKTITTTYIVEGVKEEINKLTNLLYKTEWLDVCKIE